MTKKVYGYKGLPEGLYRALMNCHYNRIEKIPASIQAGVVEDLDSAVFDGEHTFIDRGDSLSDAVEVLPGNHLLGVFLNDGRYYIADRIWGENIGKLLVSLDRKRCWLRTASKIREVTGFYLRWETI